MNGKGKGVVFVLGIEVIAEPGGEVTACRAAIRQDPLKITRKRSRNVEPTIRSEGAMDDAVIRDGAGDGLSGTGAHIDQRFSDVVERLREGLCPIGECTGHGKQQ